MEMKESFVSNVVLSISENMDFDKDILLKIQNILFSILDDYYLECKKELPSYCDNDLRIIKHFLLSKRLSGCSEKTIDTYYTHLRMFFNYVNISISSITSTNIFNFIAEKVKMNNSMSYINDIREVLFLFFTFCKKEGYINENPCEKIDRIKYTKNMESTFTDMDIVLIRKACRTDREIAMVDLFISTGIRRDELRKIKLTDIDMKNRSIYIHGKGNKNRTVYFSARCEYSLTEYINNTQKRSNIYLFSSVFKPYNQLSEDGISWIIRNIGKRANVENVHPHRFRSYFATYMINKGVPIQDLKEMLGHSCLDTTCSYYVRANLERVKFQHQNNAI